MHMPLATESAAVDKGSCHVGRLRQQCAAEQRGFNAASQALLKAWKTSQNQFISTCPRVAAVAPALCV
jgi:hypothetical protein